VSGAGEKRRQRTPKRGWRLTSCAQEAAEEPEDWCFSFLLGLGLFVFSHKLPQTCVVRSDSYKTLRRDITASKKHVLALAGPRTIHSRVACIACIVVVELKPTRSIYFRRRRGGRIDPGCLQVEYVSPMYRVYPEESERAVWPRRTGAMKAMCTRGPKCTRHNDVVLSRPHAVLLPAGRGLCTLRSCVYRSGVHIDRAASLRRAGI
jgi:hypothetical protein